MIMVYGTSNGPQHDIGTYLGPCRTSLERKPFGPVCIISVWNSHSHSNNGNKDDGKNNATSGTPSPKP